MSDPGSVLEAFDDVVIVPYSDLLDRWREGEIHRGGPLWPDWERQTTARHNRGGRPIDVRPADPSGPLAVAGPMAWAGALADAFGHQIADFSTRLLGTLQARPDLPIAFASRPDLGYDDLERAPAYARAILDWLGVPAQRVRIISAATRLAELFVAPQAEQLGGPGPGPDYLDTLDVLAEQRLGGRTHDPGLLYVSRAGMEAHFAGEAYLEAMLRAVGTHVLRPESLPLSQQLRHYRDAETVVFAEGSALHALQLLGRVDADVTVLERRTGTRLAAENLAPRVGGLRYEAVTTGLLHGLLPTGRVALPQGLALADPGGLRQVFAARGVPLEPWDDVAWRAARDADVLRWAEAQAASPARLGTGSTELILEGLRDAGLDHLRDAVAARLEPLRVRPTAVAPVRGPDQPTLLFMHLPRSGGGAVRAALCDALPAGAYAEAYAGEVPAFAPGDRPAVIVGDFAYGFHELVPGPSRYAVMLRHPVSRILSLYRTAGRPGPSLEAWVFDDRRIAADNAAVRMISGRTEVPFGGCTNDMLEAALAHIEADFAAVVSRSSMSRSAVVLGRALGMTLPPFPLVGADPAGEGSLDPPKPVRKRLRQLNHLDLELFRRYRDDF